jgi:polyhydroxybutyrate depolymerase
VRFIADLIDDVARRQTVDPLRVYATGMSNGGMMCYRLAEELAPRIAAIASVAGTPAKANPKPTRAVPVLHFHGTEDKIVPYTGPGKEVPGWLRFLSVEQTFATWAKVNGADTTGVPVPMPDAKEDGTSVVRQEAVRPGKKGASVILYTIKGGGHTWPGKPALGMLGRSTEEIDANEIIWAFFRANPLTRGAPNR